MDGTGRAPACDPRRFLVGYDKPYLALQRLADEEFLLSAVALHAPPPGEDLDERHQAANLKPEGVTGPRLVQPKVRQPGHAPRQGYRQPAGERAPRRAGTEARLHQPAEGRVYISGPIHGP